MNMLAIPIMADTPPIGRNTPLETLMRFAPAAAALSLALAATSSVGWADQREPAQRAAVLIAEGEAALAQNDVQGAIDAYEAALAGDPGYTPILLHLAEAARADELQGKLVRTDSVVQAWERSFSKIKTRLQALPGLSSIF